LNIHPLAKKNYEQLFNEASLVLVPSGYKAGKVYSEVPTNGDGDLTFTRASSATRVNSDGLIEKARTNLVLYSEQFDNAAWFKASTTVTANYAPSPNGSTTADRIVFTSSSSYVLQSFSGIYTASIYVKGTAGETIKFGVGNNVAQGAMFTFSGDWQRIVNVGSVSTTLIFFSNFNSATATDFLVWGAQLETGDIATDYIPTTTIARTTFAGITQDGTSASNVPRLDYSQGSCPALLLEPQRTNSVLYSNNTFANGTNGSSATTTTPSVIDGVIL
jgi:hypothetical protein